MIYELTYISDGLKVKGYLGIPSTYSLSIKELREHLKTVYKRSDLTVKVISNSIRVNTETIDNASLPVLIYCRGGIGKYGRVKMEWVEEYTSYGYIVFAPTYRGNEGSEGRDEFGGADREDVFAGYRLLQSFSFIDSSDISVMGFSRGSINATLLSIKEPTIRNLILWSGVSDLTDTYEERVDLRRMLKRVIGGTPNKLPDSYQSRSPIKLVEKIQCPVLIIHGTEDEQVLYSHGIKMYNQLNSLDKEVDIQKYSDYGHHYPLPVHNKAVKGMFQWISERERE
ncbi:alpha/beta hydrolase family protein [Bacillus sp. FJAT-45350]|uniref:alpha/beta hydrolase family protein n=1 Tax=Bacillus sp. FJAT-45350 TaxID=2011014 RepID=UPI000BB79514|nr:prolyl oligopeptidase family serine peptidase [Bacillus sp. FJAT-45350]